MSTEDETVQLIVKGIDAGATKVTTAVTDGLKGMERQVGATSSGVNRLVAAFGSLKDRIKAGFEFKIGADLEQLISRGLELLPHAFFGAIDAGHEWLQTVKDIERATGMTAQQSSEWAAVMERVGVPLGDVQRILAQLGHNLLENEDLFKRAGIATRDQNGQFLDTYTILGKIRQAMAANGQSIQNSGLAQELLARGGYKWLEVLQLTDEQWKAIATDAARSGEIVNEQQTRQAEEMSRLQARVQGAIQGLQNAIFSGVEPVLSQFVDQFANWITAHMQEIANFVANVASFIAGVLGGLLGIDFAAQTSAGSVEDLGKHVGTTGMSFADWAKNANAAKGADDALTTSLNAQIKAIDAQIAAIQHRSDAQHAAEERLRLDQALSSAQAQLADLKGNAPFTEGLSNAEAVLARQKHAQDIIDAEKAVADAKSGINQFEADQSVRATIDRLQAKKRALSEEVAAHRKAVDQKAAYDQYLVGVNQTQDSSIVAAAKSMYATITAQAQTWRDNGVKFADDLKGAVGGVLDALLGTETTLAGPNINGSAGIKSRSGGLVGALGGLGGMMDKIKTVIEIGVLAIIARVTIGLAGAFLSIGSGLGSLALALGPTGALALAILGIMGLLAKLGALPPPGAQWGTGWFGQPGLKIPGMASGGVVRGSSGGTIVRVAEGGKDEAIIPLDDDVRPMQSQVAARQAGPTTVIHNHFKFDFISMPSADQLRRLTDAIDERLQIKADNSPVGIQAFRGASG